MMERFNISRWAVGHPVLVSFMMVILFLSGFYGFFHLGRAEDPAFTLKNMVVSAQWSGANAEQMQSQVAEPLEQGLRDVEAIDILSTYCVSQVCVTQVFLKDDERKERVPVIWQQIRNKLSDLTSSLPSGVALAANDDYADVYGYMFALTGGENADLIKNAEYLKKVFQAIHGVGKIQISGEIPRRITVDIDPQQSNARGISLDQVTKALQSRLALAPGGSVSFKTVVPLGVSGGLDGVRSVENTPLTERPGTMRIRDIAEVSYDYAKPAPSLIRYGGKPAVVIAVAMADGADGLTLGKKLQKASTSVKLPAGMTLTQVEDQSSVIREAVNTFLIKFVVALSVVLLVAFVSLGWRPGIIVACSVPLTLAGVSLYMGMEHIGLDRISLGALILSLGLLVDDAIISIEAMVVQMELGRSREEAASFAWSHTAFPMLTGTVLTVISFLPVGLAQSTTGEYAGEIFWVSGAALLFSWIVAVVFIPFLGVHLLPEPKKHISVSYERGVTTMLRFILGFCLRYKKAVTGGTVMLLLLACGGFLLVDQQFFPQSDRPEVIVDIAMPPGTTFEETDAATGILEKRLAGSASLRHMEAHIGDGAPRFYLPYAPATPSATHATLLLVAQNLEAREDLIRQIEAMSLPAGVHLHVQRLSLGPTADFPVQYRIIGPDPEVLRSISQDVDEVLRGTDGAVSVQADWGNRSPSLIFESDPEKRAYFQTDRVSVAAQLHAAISGETAGDIPDGHHHITVIVRAHPGFRSDPGQWANLPVSTGAAATVPLSQLGNIRVTTEFPIFWQRNGELCMTVQSGVASGVQPATVVQRSAEAIEQLREKLPVGYRIETGGDVELSSTADDAIFAFLPVTGGLMLLVLMIQLQSFSRSLLVLFSAPLGLIGMVSGLLLTGAPFGFVALLGLIALAGMIMRNTILLVDKIKFNHENNVPLHDAIIDATLTRARPVCLTAIAAMLAFIPLSFNVFWGPMAIVMIGGLVGGTVLTLIAVPAFYALLFDRNVFVQRAFPHE